jgi:preprotein translocase subunit SecG
MYTLLVIMHVFVSIFLILVVLLQTGKGSGMGAAFGGSAQTLFGSRGKSTPLQKITAVMAVLFMSLSIALASFSVSGRSALTEETPADKEAGIAPEPQKEQPAQRASDASPTADQPSTAPVEQPATTPEASQATKSPESKPGTQPATAPAKSTADKPPAASNAAQPKRP